MQHPILYEIYSRSWLRGLSDRLGRKVTLATVPDTEFAAWQRLGFTHIWLMGVWTTGSKARQLALTHPNLRTAYDQMIPGWTEDDVGGSPYSIANYTVPDALGGEEGLKLFRARLHAHGLKLILDFVPNHLGYDHRWLRERPELFVQSQKQVADTFLQETVRGPRWIAHGKDPHFAGWTDTAQLEYRKRATRAAMQELLLQVAAQCDGVRCDMAMLLLNDVFARTWSHLPCDEKPRTEFWAEAIPAVKQANPDFLFIAEVYWGLEGRMQSLGFDYTYDKQLYDDMIWRNHSWAQSRLIEASPAYVAASAHFLENHDEERVAARLPQEDHCAAALAILGLPGLRFLHEGQMEGARIKLPVQLARRPVEPVDTKLRDFYEKVLATLKQTAVGRGEAKILSPRAAWPGNPSGQSFIVVQWQAAAPEFDLVVVNLAPHSGQCYVKLKVPDLAKHHWSMNDLLGEQKFKRVGTDLAQQGLYLDLPGHGAQLFRFTPAA